MSRLQNHELKRRKKKWKDPTFRAISDRLARVEWQLVCHVQQFLESKGYKIDNTIMIFDGIEVHRPTNNNNKITTEILDELHDYIKNTLNVSVTFSGTRHEDGKAIDISPTRTIQ